MSPGSSPARVVSLQRLAIGAAHWREHLHRLAVKLHVLSDAFFKHGVSRRRAERFAHAISHVFLIARERIHAHFEIGRHEVLQAVAVEFDQLSQELDGQAGFGPLLSSSKIIWVRTEWVMSSPLLAS